MKTFIVLAAVVAVVTAGGSGDVDGALLARVAQILSSSGGSGGSSGGFGRSSAPILSGPSSSYGAPSGGSFGRSAGGSGGGVQIGTPQRAQAVAEFELGGGSRGGGGGGFRSAPSSSYGAPSGGDDAIAIGRSAGAFGGGGIQIGQPQRAQRVAEFQLGGGSGGNGGFRSGGGGFRSGGGSGGYQ